MLKLIERLIQEEIEHEIRVHPVHQEMDELKERLGEEYLNKNFPLSLGLAERQHVFINDLSIIKGQVSFGSYEVYSTKGKMKDPERFEDVEDLIEFIKKRNVK